MLPSTYPRLWIVVSVCVLLLGHAGGSVAAADRSASASFQEAAVMFPSGPITLAGSLLTPTTPGPHPAVVVVHGARPNARAPYRNFALQTFVQHGVAVLIYDKRGYGASTGKAGDASLSDLADDVSAAVRYLQSRTEIDPTRIGLQGDSQAGWIMPLAATRTPAIAFLVMVSASAVSPAQQEAWSMEQQLRRAGLSEQTVDTGRKARRLLDDYAAAVRAGRLPTIGALQAVTSLDTGYNPVPILERITQPMLIFLGEADPIVPTKHSAAVFDAALRKAGNRDYTIIVYPGANHGIQVPTTNAEGQTTLGYVAGYRDTMTNWVVGHVRGRATPPQGVQGSAAIDPAFGAGGPYGPPSWGGSAAVQVPLLVLFALVFGSAPVVLGSRAIAARRPRRNRTRTISAGARRARRAGIIGSLWLLGMLVGMVALIAALLLGGAADVPRQIRIVVIVLGVVSTLTSLNMAAKAYQAWKNGYWSLVERGYYTLVAVVALVFVPFLVYWRMLG